MLRPRYKYTHLQVVGGHHRTPRKFGASQLRQAFETLEKIKDSPGANLCFYGATVQAGDFLLGPQVWLKHEFIKGLTPRQLWAKVDRKIDISRVRTALATTLHGSSGRTVNKSARLANNRMVAAPDLEGDSEEIRIRYRHFAALIWLQETINFHPPGTSPEIAAAIDAELDPQQSYYACAALAQGDLYALLK